MPEDVDSALDRLTKATERVVKKEPPAMPEGEEDDDDERRNGTGGR